MSVPAPEPGVSTTAIRQPMVPADFTFFALFLSLLGIGLLPAVILPGFFGLPVLAAMCLFSAARGIVYGESWRQIVRDLAHAATCIGLWVILTGVNMSVDSPFYGASPSWEQRLKGRQFCEVGGWIAGASAVIAFVVSLGLPLRGPRTLFLRTRLF